MVEKADISVTKELDLIKFIRRQRLQTYATLATLNARQSFIVDQMAQLLIRESSDLGESTDSDMELLQENMKDVAHYSKTVFESKDSADRRLVQLYRLKRSGEDRKRTKANKKEVSTIPKPSGFSSTVVPLQS